MWSLIIRTRGQIQRKKRATTPWKGLLPPALPPRYLCCCRNSAGAWSSVRTVREVSARPQVILHRSFLSTRATSRKTSTDRHFENPLRPLKSQGRSRCPVPGIEQMPAEKPPAGEPGTLSKSRLPRCRLRTTTPPGARRDFSCCIKFPGLQVRRHAASAEGVHEDPVQVSVFLRTNVRASSITTTSSGRPAGIRARFQAMSRAVASISAVCR